MTVLEMAGGLVAAVTSVVVVMMLQGMDAQSKADIVKKAHDQAFVKKKHHTQPESE